MYFVQGFFHKLWFLLNFLQSPLGKTFLGIHKVNWLNRTPCYLNKGSMVNKSAQWQKQYRGSLVCVCLNCGFALKKNVNKYSPMLWCPNFFCWQSGQTIWNKTLCNIKGRYSQSLDFWTEGTDCKVNASAISVILMLKSARKSSRYKSPFHTLQHT